MPLMARNLSGPFAGSITFTLAGSANNPGPIAVALTVFQSGTSAAPFGNVDPPTDSQTGVSGAIPVTGWGARRHRHFARRDLPAASRRLPPNCGGAADVFIGFAVSIEGARPDVAAAFPAYSANTLGGWGFMVLTNMLPSRATAPTSCISTRRIAKAR
ncbi:MAG TPA: hypothetical protein VH740_16315 [Vicinamibacterales bacterium]